MMLEDGDDPRAVERRIDRMLAERKEIDYFYFAEDELFTSREVIEAIMFEIRDFHETNKEAIAGFAFETFMANVWERCGYEVSLPVSKNNGEDWQVRREEQNDWITISAKSQNRATGSKGKINIDSLARHSVNPIVLAEHCAEAVQAAVEHLAKYERIIYLRSVRGDYFPVKEAKPAHRYDFVEVPKEDMAERLTEQCTADDFLRLFKKSDFKNKSTFNVPIYQDSKEVFSVSVYPKHIRIGGIDVESYCRVVSQYWTEPLPARRADS